MGRNVHRCLKLIAWALERDFPWAGYPPGVMSRGELRRVSRGSSGGKSRVEFGHPCAARVARVVP